jgi:transposase
MQQTLTSVSQERDIEVVRVDHDRTSTECHRCGTAGEQDWSRFRCVNDACLVSEVDVDAPAAISIANRY